MATSAQRPVVAHSVTKTGRWWAGPVCVARHRRELSLRDTGLPEIYRWHCKPSKYFQVDWAGICCTTLQASTEHWASQIPRTSLLPRDRQRNAKLYVLCRTASAEDGCENPFVELTQRFSGDNGAAVIEARCNVGAHA